MIRVLSVGVLLVALTGCATAGHMGDPAEPGPDASQEFGPARVQRALLTEEDLGGPFEVAPSDDDDFDSGVDYYDQRFGCLTAFDVLDNKANDPADAAREFDTGVAGAVADVLTAVISYRSEDLADKAMDDLARELKRCRAVDYTDPSDGIRWQLEPHADEEGRADGGDRQINVGGTGTFSGGKNDVDASLTVQGTAVRVGHNVALVLMFDATDDLGDAPDAVAQAAVERLAAVDAGDDLPRPRAVLDDYSPAGDSGVDT